MQEKAQRKSDLSERLGDCYYDINSVSQFFNVSPRTVHRLVAAKKFPQPEKIGHSTRFRHSDIQAYLQELRLQQKDS